MRTMWRFRYAIVACIALSCVGQDAPDPDTDRMAIILEKMVLANAEVSGDSLIARRTEILKDHNTSEDEVRAWIARVSKNPDESLRVSQQLTAALEDTSRQRGYRND